MSNSDLESEYDFELCSAEPQAKTVRQEKSVLTKREEWQLLDKASSAKERIEILKKGNATYGHYEPSGTIESARRLAAALKSGRHKDIKQEIRQLLQLNLSINDSEEIVSIFDDEDLLWAEGALRFKLPLRFFPWKLRTTNAVALLADPLELIKFWNYPSPSSYVSTHVKAMTLYAKLPQLNAIRPKKAAFINGASYKY